MAPVFSKFFTITSRVKGDHIYNAKPNINAKCVCYLLICNQRIVIQTNAIVVKTKERPSNSAEPDSDVNIAHILLIVQF